MSKNGTLNRNNIKEQIKLIPNTRNYYVSENGNIYKLTNNNKFLKIKTMINPYNDYVYCGIRYNYRKVNVSTRVHRLVALCFIPNPNNLPIVGHKDNNKSNNKVNNLYWTTLSENTQKAVNDHLMVNDKGIEDSQSNPVACYKNNHELVAVYGSISEAGRCIKGSSKSSVHKVLDKTTKGRKGYYFKSITKEFYKNHKEIAGLKFKIAHISKPRTTFKIFKDGKYLFTSNNQKQTGLKINVPQGIISSKLKRNSLRPTKNGYVFVKIKETPESQWQKKHNKKK